MKCTYPLYREGGLKVLAPLESEPPWGIQGVSVKANRTLGVGPSHFRGRTNTPAPLLDHPCCGVGAGVERLQWFAGSTLWIMAQLPAKLCSWSFPLPLFYMGACTPSVHCYSCHRRAVLAIRHCWFLSCTLRVLALQSTPKNYSIGQKYSTLAISNIVGSSAMVGVAYSYLYFWTAEETWRELMMPSSTRTSVHFD